MQAFSKILAGLFPLMAACGGEPTALETTTPSTTPGGCTYPEGAVEPMALNQVLSPYRWPVAIHRDGRADRPNLRLANVPCANDAEIDWSPFEALLFVSIPAW